MNGTFERVSNLRAAIRIDRPFIRRSIDSRFEQPRINLDLQIDIRTLRINVHYDSLHKPRLEIVAYLLPGCRHFGIRGSGLSL